MKFRLLSLLFLLQCIVLARTQFITRAGPKTSTSNTAKPSTPTSSTVKPPTLTSSTAEPSTLSSSTTKPPTSTASSAETPTPSSSTAERSTLTSSSTTPTTPTFSTATPPIPTSNTAKPPTPSSSTAKTPTPTSSTANSPTTISEHITSSFSVPTSTQKPKSCPEKQSAFYKDDLNQLIDQVENEMNIVANLNQSVYRNVKNTSNELMLELNSYLIGLEDQPKHILTTLDDIKMKREKNIVPLIKTANNTLNEFLSVEHGKVAKLIAEMAKLLTAKYKAEQFCKYACDFSFRVLNVKNNRVIINDDNYLCSTIPEVIDKVKKWFVSFMEEQSKSVAENINNHKNKINESISELKVKISDASQTIFGVSMANVLHLQHDVIRAVESIEEFNGQSYKYTFGLVNANLSMLHVEFKKNINLYRKKCVKCDSMAFRMDVSEKRIPKSNVLDHLLDEKATDLEDKSHAIITTIFSDLYKKLNDDNLVQKIVHKLDPLAKDLAVRTTQERKDFDVVMQSAPEEDRKLMAGLYNETVTMLSSIIKKNEELQDMIHSLP